MQQTTTYKLNKPESTDTFSVSPLNENADTLEAQLARLDGADAAETAARQALDQRVTALEVQKIFFGTVVYEGNNEVTVNLGFTPVAVLFVDRLMGERGVLAIGENFVYATQQGTGEMLKIVENGFAVRSGDSAHFFTLNRRYNYIAFA